MTTRIQQILQIDELTMWGQRYGLNVRRRRDVKKNWHLIQVRRREDPERHLTEKLPRANSTDIPPGLPVQLHTEMVVFQEEVLDWLEMAMLSWFDFYFALGPGTIHDRLAEASARLGKASEGLDAISAQMKYLPGREPAWTGPVQAYREAVADWGKSLGLIAKGTTLDFKSLAREGFSLMNITSANAETIVHVRAGPDPGVDVHSRLDTLSRLRPAKRVPRKAMAAAKAPWMKAIVAAGSKIDWSPYSELTLVYKGADD